MPCVNGVCTPDDPWANMDQTKSPGQTKAVALEQKPGVNQPGQSQAQKQIQQRDKGATKQGDSPDFKRPGGAKETGLGSGKQVGGLKFEDAKVANEFREFLKNNPEAQKLFDAGKLEAALDIFDKTPTKSKSKDAKPDDKSKLADKGGVKKGNADLKKVANELRKIGKGGLANKVESGQIPPGLTLNTSPNCGPCKQLKAKEGQALAILEKKNLLKIIRQNGFEGGVPRLNNGANPHQFFA